MPREFIISTTGLNVTLNDFELTLIHPSTLDLYAEGFVQSEILDSQELQDAIDTGVLTVVDGDGVDITTLDSPKIINSSASKDYFELTNVPISINPLIIEDKSPGTTFQLSFSGNLLDFITGVTLTGDTNNTGLSASIVSKDFFNIVVSISTNPTEQNYTIELTSADQTFTFNFLTRLITGTGTAGTTAVTFAGNNLGPFSQQGNRNWSFSGGGTPSTGTGPNGPPPGFTTYIFAETSNPVIATDTFIIETSDFATLTTVSFQYHMFGDAMGTLSVQYSNNNGASWIDKQVLAGQQQLTQGEVWRSSSLNFSATPATNLRFFYTGRSNFTADCSITDITIVSV